MPFSKINGDMTDENVNQVLKHLDDAKALMAFLASITEEQRIEMERKKRNPMNFIKHTQTHMESHPEFIPPTTPLPGFQRILKLLHNLRRIDVAMDSFHKDVKDTITVLETDAYSLARLYYKSVRNATKEGDYDAERIYNDLSVHFKPKHKRKKTSETTTEEQTKE